MAKSRKQLQKMLAEQLDTTNVYFQPPESLKMEYPAIVYKLSDIDNKMANNSVYKQNKAYDITVIDNDPDSKLVEKMSMLATFITQFTLDNLYHTVFRLYY